MESKKWYQSKTIWFNIVSGVVGVAGALLAPEVGLNPTAAKVFAGIVSAGNIVLRLVTDTPVTTNKP